MAQAQPPSRNGPRTAAWIAGIGAVLAILSAIAGLRSGAPIATGLEGTLAPDFDLPRIDAGASPARSRPAQSRGLPLLLHFWAPSCEPCVAELPTWQALVRQSRVPDAEFAVLTVTAAEPSEVRSFLAAHQLTLPTVIDANGAVHDAYHVAGIPHTVVLSKSGVIVRELTGAQDAAQVKQALQAARTAR